MGRVVEAGSSAELVKRGAVRATMEAMARHVDSAPVQDVGCALVCALAWHPASQRQVNTTH